MIIFNFNKKVVLLFGNLEGMVSNCREKEKFGDQKVLTTDFRIGAS